jgi:hypothetical protein
VTRIAAKLRRPGAAALLAATFALTVATVTAAHFTTKGSGTASAGVTTLAHPTITTATAGPGTAALSWTSVTPPGSGTVSYYVTRDGGAPAGNCPTSSSTSTVTSCTDSGLALGSHKYTVTALWRTWTATSEAKSVEVTKLSQTISFTSTAPSAATVSGATYTVSATGGGSGNAVTFTIDATSTSVCSIAGKTVSFTAAGACTIDANQAGNGTYEAAPQAQQSFTVGKGSQTIGFGPLSSRRFDQGPITVSATASSGLAVSFSSTTTGVCTVSGTTVSFLGIGTCTVKAEQTGDSNWNAATPVSQSFTIGTGNQTISFTSTAPTEATVGGATYTPTATASSGLAVSFTIDASAGSVCSISGGVVSFKAAGTCAIDANQPGNSNWNAAPQVQQSFIVKGLLTIAGVVKDGGKVKVHFTGSGAIASTTITVTICKVNVFPCTGTNIAGTSTASNPSAGSWTSAQDSNNLNESATTYFAQAIQGSATSAVFTFSTAGL